MNVKIIDKPNDMLRVFPFNLPNSLKKKAKLVCIKRGISLGQFIRESMKLHLKKYKDIIL